MSNRLPYEMREAMIAVCGRAFWLKGPLRDFLASSGVPTAILDRYAHEHKFPMARHVLAELDAMGDEGYSIQRRVLTEMCRLQALPDTTVDDKESGVKALRHVKEVARTHDLLIEEKRSHADDRAARARMRQTAIAARAEKMQELRRVYSHLATGKDTPQSRGYTLEELLAQLFEAHEIPYRRPYKLATEQIDGSFEFGGFHYLVEARWRKQPPPESDLSAFMRKVEKKLTSTRGLFVSVMGFRPEVVLELTRGTSSNIVLMDGQDISLILEGQAPLTDALTYKIEKASQEGLIYVPLAQRHR